MIDRMITHAYLLTMADEQAGLILDGAVAMDGNQILAVGTTEELKATYQAKEEIDARGKAVMPGLVDAHIHTSMALYRGVAQDTHHWLQKGVGPFFGNITAEEAVIGSRLNIVEGIKAGTTTFSDFDNPMPLIAENYQQAGVRARMTSTVNALPPHITQIRSG